MNGGRSAASDDAAFLGVQRSVTGRRWRLRANDERQVLALAQRLGAPEPVARVLAGRGVPLEGCEDFLSPSLRRLLPDPSRLADMDRACARAAEAIMTGERVAVFGDYDVDGATSAALLIRVFNALGRPLRLYVPDRLREGYGPNAPALERLAAEGCRLVLTVDCGISAHEALAAGAAAGLDIVVLDHHQATPVLPPAYAVVDPNRLDDASGCGQLAAVGVSFLFCVGLLRTLRQAGWFKAQGKPEPDLRQWLDLVALGTICDVAALTGVNRAFVAQGLRVMAQGRNPGLAALAEVARLDGPPGVYHAGFLLGPRVNAGGRVGRADLGARLLSTEDRTEAAELAALLDRANRERQTIEAMVLEEALAQIEASGAADAPVLVAAGRGGHPGVVGIVASRLVQRYRRPAFVLALDGPQARGSGRSVAGVDLGAAVLAAREAGLIEHGGGHAMAAGLSVAAARINDLRDFLCARLAPQVAAGTAHDLGLDGAISARGATMALIELLERAGPYGAGCPEPRFAALAVRAVRAVPVGTNHLRCVFAAADGARLQAIAFRCADTPLGEALSRAQPCQPARPSSIG
jgi:single-stranded-DNA-specific exonuclease